MVDVGEFAVFDDVLYLGMGDNDRSFACDGEGSLVDRFVCQVTHSNEVTIIRVSTFSACLLHLYSAHDGYTFRHEICTSAAVYVFSLDVSHRVICTAAKDNLELRVLKFIVVSIFQLTCVPHVFQCVVEITHGIGKRRAFLLIVVTLSLVLHHLHRCGSHVLFVFHHKDAGHKIVGSSYGQH